MFHTKPAILVAVLLLAMSSNGYAQNAQSPAENRQSRWEPLLAMRLPRYGHRNWIVVADSAYPSQSQSGIETIVTNAGQFEVVRAVLDGLQNQRHVRPMIYLDAELPFVEERDAPGIDQYRKELTTLLAGRTTQSLPHEAIIDQLDVAGEKFNVLVLKTNLTLPYTSVFIELDCGYWSAEQEARLREAMKAAR
jgi:hypothetical protein